MIRNVAGMDANRYVEPMAEGSKQLWKRGMEGIYDASRGGFANPWLDGMVDQATTNAIDDVAGRAAASGRYGSYAMGAGAGEGAANAELGLRYSDANRREQRMDAANRALVDMGVQGANMGNQMLNNDVSQARLMGELGMQRNREEDLANTSPLRQAEWITSQSLPTGSAFGRGDSWGFSKQNANVGGMIASGVGMLSGMGGAGGIGGLFGGGGGGGGGSAPLFGQGGGGGGPLFGGSAQTGFSMPNYGYPGGGYG